MFFLRYGSSDRPAGTIPLNLLGMVGGHGIPVGPYYLVQNAKEVGYHSRVTLAGRSINDSMPRYPEQDLLFLFE